MLELNSALLRGTKDPLSLMAQDGQLTCLSAWHDDADGRHPAPAGMVIARRWLHAIMGFEPVDSGFISIDGEPLTATTVLALRRLMAFVPDKLDDVGQIMRYEAPTVQEIFALKTNRQLPISNGMLAEEVKRTGVTGPQAQLLAVAVLLQRRVLLIDSPVSEAIPYLLQQASEGRTVIVASADETVRRASHQVVRV